MSTDNIETKVIEIVKEKLKKADISAASSFVDDMAADSLDIVEVMMEIEKQCECDIPDDDAAKMKTIADVVQYIEKYKESKDKK